MSEGESLSLLHNIVGPAVGEDPRIKDLANFFISKSRNLPVEITVIGKALSYFVQSDSGLQKLESIKEEIMLLDIQNFNLLNLLSSGYEPLPSSVLIDCCRPSNHFLRKCGSVHYKELITYWILEGYLGDFPDIEDAFEKGHSVLLELIDCGLVKEQEAGYVFMNGGECYLDELDLCQFIGTIHLGLDIDFDSNKGDVALADAMTKTLGYCNQEKKTSMLLLDGNHLSMKKLPDHLFHSKEEIEVLAIFNPTFDMLPLPLFEMHKLRLLVLRGCDSLENLEEVDQFETPNFFRSVSDINKHRTLKIETLSVPEKSDLGFLLPKLTVLEISGPSSLKEIPDDFFKHLPRLQNLNLSSLKIDSLPSSFYNLTELVLLFLRGCSRLQELRSLRNFKKLQVLDLSGATSFKGFKDRSFSSNKELRRLDLSQSQITSLPIMSDLGKLTHLLLRDCTQLEMLRKIASLTSLQFLDLSGATNFYKFRESSFGQLVNIKGINLSQTLVDKLPSNISNPNHLLLRGCSLLKKLHYIQSLAELQVLDLSGSSSLKKIEDKFFKHMTCLKVLNLSETNIKSITSLSILINLRQLLLSCCLSLEMVGGLNFMTKLEVLDLSGCAVMRELKARSFEHMRWLRKLNLSGTQITCLPALPNPSNLTHLLLENCTKLKVFPPLGSQSKLKELNLAGVRCIENIGADLLEHMDNLCFLDVSGTKLKYLPSLSNVRNLNYLSLRDCPCLTEVPGLESLTKLEVLDLSGTAVKDLPSFDNFHNLRHLLLKGCSNLAKFQHMGILEVLGMITEELPYNISTLANLEQLELPNRRITASPKI